jgi:carbon-monoxide dehydrogenase medium subunit
LPAFALCRPLSVEEAVELLAAAPDSAAVYMGGTELIPIMRLGLTQFTHLVDCKRIPELQVLVVRDDAIEIGAAVTHARIASDPEVHAVLPVLTALENRIANIRVRNVGTVGGNLCFAEPNSDPAPLLMVLGASVELASATGRRVLPVEDFIQGPLQTALREDEILTRVIIPRPAAGARAAFERLSYGERPTAIVAVNVNGNGRGTRVAVGAVGPRPVRALEAEALLAAGSRDAISKAGVAAAHAAAPIEGLDGSAAYKGHLVSVLLERALARAGMDPEAVYPKQGGAR